MHFDPQSNIISPDEEAAQLAPRPSDGPGRETRTVPVTLVLGVCLVLVAGLMWQMVGPGLSMSFAAEAFDVPAPIEMAFTPHEEPEAVATAPPQTSARRASRAVSRTVARQESSGNHLVSEGRVHYFRGRTYLDQGRIDDAVTELTEAVRLAPNHADAHYKLGLAYVGLRDSDAARQELALLEKLDPSLASLLGNLVR